MLYRDTFDRLGWRRGGCRRERKARGVSLTWSLAWWPYAVGLVGWTEWPVFLLRHAPKGQGARTALSGAMFSAWRAVQYG
jgi:hypothetical protein